MTEIRFDFPIVPADLSFEAIRQLAQEAESLGYGMISVGDHLVREQPLFEQWTTLAFVAACTDTIEIGSLITNPAFRSPALLANLPAGTIRRRIRAMQRRLPSKSDTREGKSTERSADIGVNSRSTRSEGAFRMARAGVSNAVCRSRVAADR